MRRRPDPRRGVLRCGDRSDASLLRSTCPRNRGRQASPWGVDTVTKFLAKIVAWITAGYPEGVPGPDRVPLLALLKRRLTDNEVRSVAKELRERGEFDHVDIGVLITQ